MDKIIKLDYLKTLCENIRQQDKSIVLAGGCFDILHLGHVTFLDQAKKEGDILIVLLESDETIKSTKGAERPIHSQNDRAYMLSQLLPVDYIILLKSNMTNSDYDDVVNWIQPAIIAATVGDSGISHKERQAALVGAKVVFVTQEIPNMSTSRIVKILSEEQ